MKIKFKTDFNIDISDPKLTTIIKKVKGIIFIILQEILNNILLNFAEYYMENKKEAFCCERCGNKREFVWKTRHGRETGIMTILGNLKLKQLQIKCKECGHKFYITRILLGIKKRKRIPDSTRKKLGIIGALTTYRVSKKIASIFGYAIDKMTIWRAVQSSAKKINFDLDVNEKNEGEADGTGVPIKGIKKRGKELKVFVQAKRSGGVRVAGVAIGNYDSEWNKLFKPLLKSLKSFKSFLLVTDGDTNIFKPLKKIVNVVLQRCLWHIPHQMKYYLWKDKVKRKSENWLKILSVLLRICSIQRGIEENDIKKAIIESKEKQLEALIRYCEKNNYESSANYLKNAKPDMFKAVKNNFFGRTTSHAERVMKTMNARINVGKWTPQGALNISKIRLAYYYNGYDRE